MCPNIPILMYHQITPNIHPKYLPCSVTPETFATHLKILKLFGYSSIDLNQLENYKKGYSRIPRKPIIITFDDCYKDSVKYTVPLLKANKFTAVFFIPTEYIGKHSSWLMPKFGFEFPIIDWDTVQFLDSNGFQIGSHTMTHHNLTSLSPKKCYEELQGSRKTLEDYLGHEIVHLAYPYGYFDDSVKLIASELGYRTACSTIERLAKFDDDPLVLPRLNIQGYYSPADFISLVHMESNWLQFIIKIVRRMKRFFSK